MFTSVYIKISNEIVCRWLQANQGWWKNTSVAYFPAIYIIIMQFNPIISWTFPIMSINRLLSFHVLNKKYPWYCDIIPWWQWGFSFGICIFQPKFAVFRVISFKEEWYIHSKHIYSIHFNGISTISIYGKWIAKLRILSTQWCMIYGCRSYSHTHT